jgi:hypothetical protein
MDLHKFPYILSPLLHKLQIISSFYKVVFYTYVITFFIFSFMTFVCQRLQTNSLMLSLSTFIVSFFII